MTVIFEHVVCHSSVHKDSTVVHPLHPLHEIDIELTLFCDSVIAWQVCSIEFELHVKVSLTQCPSKDTHPHWFQDSLMILALVHVAYKVDVSYTFHDNYNAGSWSILHLV